MKYCMLTLLSKRGKLGTKILFRYADIVIFMLGYFILAHPVHYHDFVDDKIDL